MFKSSGSHNANYLRLKIPYRALTDLHTPEDKYLLNSYILLKSQAEGLTKKPGFISKSEIKVLASTFEISQSTLYKRLNRLSRAGYIKKHKYGYTLTSTNHIHNNLHNFKTSKNKKGRMYHPYASIEIPETNSLRIVELTSTYLLLKQIINRKSKSNGLRLKQLRKQNVPDKITIALEYLRKAGKYQSKMTVSKLMDDLEAVGLLKIKKGKFDSDGLWYDTNEYEVYSLKNANWKMLNTPKQGKYSWLENMSKPETRRKKSVVKTKSGMTETPRAKAKKTVLNEVEQRFIDFTEKGKWVLVRNGFIPASFEKKKVRKNMIPNILNKILSDEGMKNIFLTQFSLDNIMLTPKGKIAYNPKAYVYDRYNNTYSIDYVELVPNGGNYTGRLLAEHQDRYYESISMCTTHTSAI